MLYNSVSYLVFFVAVFVGYWCLRGHRARLALLLFSSWLFYAAWYPSYLLLFLLVTGITYAGGVWIEYWIPKGRAAQRRVVVAAVVIDLGTLAYFKYAGFLLNTAGSLAGAAGVHVVPPTLHVVLPLGISFYTFQSIAYVVDVYRGEVQAIRNPLKLALFKAFFPQLIAGPIVRAAELVPQFADARPANPGQFAAGLDLIAVGLIKKVVIADRIAPFADNVFQHPSSLSSLVLLLGVYAYAAQIYCDFSGYTDIGRGCAKLLGFELPINFNFPYLSVNIVDFWRRWHISLSRWLRDYLYIPLGGSRRGRARTYVNLLLTMVLGGLWHGASWTFVVWGALHGVALAVSRFLHEVAKVPPEQPLVKGRTYRAFAIVATFHFVCIGWVFFRAPTFAVATTVLHGIISLRPIGAPDLAMFGWINVALVGLSLVAVYALHAAAYARPTFRHADSFFVVPRGLLYASCVIAITLFGGGGTQQFIYFQF